jgi:hypothetical protein
MNLSLCKARYFARNTLSGNLERYFGERRESAAVMVSSETVYRIHAGTGVKLLSF